MKLSGYARLADNIFLKRLEGYFLFDKRHDELYALNEKAFSFLTQLGGTRRLEDLKFDKTFVNKLFKENLIYIEDVPNIRNFLLVEPPLPSVRYLEIQVTERCNIDCKHCYQGSKGKSELSINDLKMVLDEFYRLQGLRVIISGGEPLMYSKFEELNALLKNYPARVVLLTNGTLIERCDVKALNFDEIQFSLDGMEAGHDYLRGKESFKKLVSAVEKIKEMTNIDVSFATIIHKNNLKEFKEMKRFVKSFGAKEWGIDMPALSGNLGKNLELYVDAEDAIKAMSYRFGASFHATDEDNDYACGAHLMTLNAKGEFLPCSFYPDTVLGRISDGLENAIRKRRLITRQDIQECRECEKFKDCRGGCRFRAGSFSNRDLVMCKVFGKK